MKKAYEFLKNIPTGVPIGWPEPVYIEYKN